MATNIATVQAIMVAICEKNDPSDIHFSFVKIESYPVTVSCWNYYALWIMAFHYQGFR